ncbi:MAG: hypothetical protein JHC95_03225 [Solirubrobacteraceae bacterium]|nr:hypothetical protein [Solirubrobacteraceae bacterium]
MRGTVQARLRGLAGRAARTTGLAVLAVAVCATAAPAEPIPQLAVPADAALDAVGVNTKFTDTTDAHCGLVPALVAGLRDLHVRHVRDAVSTWDKAVTRCQWVDPSGAPRDERAIDLLAGLAPNVRTMLLVGAMNRTTWLQGLTVAQVLDRVDREGPENDVLDAAEILARAGALEGMEGANEFDLAGLRTFRIGGEEYYPWRSTLRAHQAGLYARVKAASRPLLRDTPLLGPSFGRLASYAAYTENGLRASETQDAGNLHFYTGGAIPEKDVDDAVDAGRLVADGQPLIVTETGYHTAPLPRGSYGELTGVPEAVAAVYLPRLVLELQRLGVDRSYLFELRDHRDFGPQDGESYYGLLRWDGSRRPAFGAMARLLETLDDPGPAYDPAPLSYELAGDLRGVRSRLFGRRDGSYVLALWRAEPVWEPFTGLPLPVWPRNVNVVLAEPDRYDAVTGRPSQGGGDDPLRWRAARRAAGPITLDLTGDVQLLKLSPRGAALLRARS